jgi:hypothetical protein
MLLQATLPHIFPVIAAAIGKYGREITGAEMAVETGEPGVTSLLGAASAQSRSEVRRARLPLS